MKVNANTMRPGHVMEHNGKLFAVLKTQIVQPGKGGAFIQIEMRDVRSGNNGKCTHHPARWCKAQKGWDGPTGLGTPNGVGGF